METLAGSARLGALAACSSLLPTVTVYALDESVHGGARPRFKFGYCAPDPDPDFLRIGNICDVAFTDSPEAHEPPLLLLADPIGVGVVHIVDVSGAAVVYVGQLIINPTVTLDTRAFQLQTRNRTLAVGAWRSKSILLYEGYGNEWILKRKVCLWDIEASWTGIFCLANAGDHITIARREEPVFNNFAFVVVDCDGRECHRSIWFPDLWISGCGAIVSCEDGWFVHNQKYIRYIPRDDDDQSAAVDITGDPFHAYMNTVVYIPGAGIFAGCSSSKYGGLVGFQDRRRLSILRRAWCAAVIRGIVKFQMKNTIRFDFHGSPRLAIY